MRTGPVRVWLGAAACVAVLFSAFGWVSCKVLDLERSRQAMTERSSLEENVRLSLWRMDSAAAPIIARESTRASEQYQTSFARDRYVKLHFQFETSGRLSSPQGPSEALSAFARLVEPERLAKELASKQPEQQVLLASAADIERRLGDLRPRLATDDSARQAADGPTTDSVLNGGVQDANERQMANSSLNGSVNDMTQMQRSSNEFAQRQWSVGNAYNNVFSGSLGSLGVEQGASGLAGLDLPGDWLSHAMVPLWIGDELLLARRVALDGREVIQGCWLDWSAMKEWLQASVTDLLPSAQLVPAPSEAGDPTRRLVSLPAQVVAGGLPGPAPGDRPTQWILIAVWCAVLLAAGAAVALILGISTLSERRASFVAAVTHELRTPLTTLQTYSEMLADGKVTDEGKRNRYVRTLHREAVRLGHLVENVLSYSRIERGRSGLRRDQVDARRLLQRSDERLRERAKSARMELSLELPDDGDLSFVGDEAAVEQIVFNLVDNAAKYAAGANERTIEVSARKRGQMVEIKVRDHGPGLADDARKRLFKPFSKSVERAAVSAPGVGLGLALSRRLARTMGGRLQLDESVTDGACFALHLPTA